MKLRFYLMLTVLICMFALPAGGQTVLSDFEDSTLQGWTPNDSLEGEVYVATGGNPGYCMGYRHFHGRERWAVAPPEFAGDLSGYSGVQWDAFVPDKGSATVQRTFIILQSANLTRFRSTYDISQIPIETWNTRFASFRAEHWEFIHGTESFEDVLRDVGALKISLETARGEGIESYVDNVTLITRPVNPGYWSSPVHHPELNSELNNAKWPCISSDRYTVYFVRRLDPPSPPEQYYIFEAHRDEPFGPFTSERMLTELGNNGSYITYPWISGDGLRLYYMVWEKIAGVMQHVIKMAVRKNPSEEWVPTGHVPGINVSGYTNTQPTLTGDELTIIYASYPYRQGEHYKLWMAMRPTIFHPFGDITEVVELNELGAYGPELSSDGLRVYVTIKLPNGTPNIYMGYRGSPDEPFVDFHLVEGISGPETRASSPSLTPDERTMCFGSMRGDELELIGVWISYWQLTPYKAAIEKINHAIAQKTEAIDKVNTAIDSEMAAIDELNELLRNIPEDLTRRDICRAKLNILHSVRRQIRARIELRKGISQLRQALENLQAPLPPPPPGPGPASLPTGPAGGPRRILERDPASNQLTPR